MTNASSDTVDPNVGWQVDNRGYIHGGFDTPVFGVVKQKHNAELTRRKNKIKKSLAYGIIPFEEAKNLSIPEIRRRTDEYMAQNKERLLNA